MPLSTPTIDLGDFCLRAWRMSDAEARARHGNHPKIIRYMFDSFGSPHTVEKAREFIEKSFAHDKSLRFCISVDEEAVGSLFLHVGEDVNRYSAEVGYWLGLEHWGKGIMTRALKTAVRVGFDNHGLRRIHATLDPENRRSAQVLKRAGFKLEGRLKHAVCRDGRFIDDLIYALVSTNRPDI
jgi:ribosomal-protein-alanine N-acetyltransferase